jgi:hypothetical protein
MANERAIIGPFWLAIFTAIGAGAIGHSVGAGTPESDEETKSESASETSSIKGRAVDVENAFKTMTHTATITDRRFIIATIPDPIDTAAGSMFDSFIDAIQRAFEKQGYVLEHHYLPWTLAKPTHHSEPGILIFASNTDRQAVLLVGETPTWGVHGAAFDAALRIVHRSGTDEETKKGVLRILGPSFTGSARSIRERLKKKEKDMAFLRSIKIASGSATGDVEEILRGTRLTVEYTPLALSDDVVLNALLQYLESAAMSWAQPPIAFLVESNTGYGEQLKSRLTARMWNRPPIVIPFPMQIGAVRQEIGKSQKDSAGGGELRAATTENQLRARDARQTIDVPPLLVPGLSAPAIEVALRNELGALAKDGVQLVGIFGTNTADKVFLAGQVRKSIPDVRLFTLESDVLMEGLEYDELGGMLVASRAPLTRAFPRCAQDPNEHQIFRVPFASSAAAGVYDATRALLDPKFDQGPRTVWITEVSRGTFFIRKRVELQGPEECDPPSRCRGPQARPKLPNFFRMVLFVLLAVVAVTVHSYERAIGSMPARDATDTTRDAKSRRLSWLLQPFPDDPENSELRFVLARLTTLLCCVAVNLVPLLAVPMSTLSSCDVSFFYAGCVGIAALSYTCTNIYYRFPEHSVGWVDVVARGIAISAPYLAAMIAVAWAWPYHRDFSILIAAIMGQLLGVVRGPPTKSDSEGVASRRWLIGGAIGVGFIAVIWFEPAQVAGLFGACNLSTSFAALQVAERFGRLTTAPSPLWGILAIGYGLHVWSDCGLRRAARLIPGPIEPRVAVLDSILSIERKSKETHPLTRSLAEWFGGVPLSRLSIGFVIAVLVPFIYIGRRFLPTLEGLSVDLTLFLGLFCVYLATGHALIRFAWTWIALKDVLTDLAWHPMIHAFDRLSDRFRVSLSSQLYTVGPADAEYELAKQEQRIVADALGVGTDGDQWKTASNVAAHLKRELWSKQPTRAMAPDKAELPAHSPLAAKGPDIGPLLAAEDNVALHISLLIRELDVHLFAHLAAVVAGIVSLVLAITIYPFQTKQLMMTATWSVTAAAMAVVFWVLVSMERDNILSRLAGTTPGQINFNFSFLTRLGQVIVPLVVLLASQFSSVRIIVSEALNIVSLVVR